MTTAMETDYRAPFEPVASLDIMVREDDGKERLKWIGIGATYRDDQGNWLCPFACTWVHDHSIPAFGADPIDAVKFAVAAIDSLVKTYRDSGRTFFYRDSGEEYGVPPPEPAPEQKEFSEATSKLQDEVHSALQAGKSKEDVRQMVSEFKRRRGMQP